MKKWIALSALLLPLTLAGCTHRDVVVYAAPPPPPAFDAIAQQGYNQGFAAAQRDVADGRRPDLERHPRFRNPPVPGPNWEDYRHGFREGYNAFLHQAPR